LDSDSSEGCPPDKDDDSEQTITVLSVQINSVTSDKNVECVGSNIRFTATTNPSGQENNVSWSGGGHPDTGTGPTFDTHWHTSDIYTVTASICGSQGTKQVTIVEVGEVRAGGKSTGQTLFLANDDLDEPAERELLNQGVIADLFADTLAVSTTPDSFSWTPLCGSLPKICPYDANGATFTAKDHDLRTITATCCDSSKSMSIAIEGINIYTYISAPDEMNKTYNIFLNENFDQQRELSTLPGHKQCYYVDHSDDSLTDPYIDNMDEIGLFHLNAVIWGDNPDVTFESSGLKLYDSALNKLEFYDGTESHGI
jgi:hypothetical protein